ncbi:MAG TPA: response regulator [Chloroflexota bacterium]|nr:response regulator [Chloroflexota bacterium]
MPGGDGRYVLVAEDDGNLRQLLVTVINEITGMPVGAVDDGAQALQHIEQRGSPALVLADICMPNVDGLSLLGAMRGSLPDVPMIAMSALSNADEAIATGYDDFLLKPFDFDDLSGKLQRWLAGTPGATGSEVASGSPDQPLGPAAT